MGKDYGAHGKAEDGKLKKPVHITVKGIVESIMMLWIVASFILLTIWISQEYQKLLNQPTQTNEEKTIEKLRTAHRHHGINYSQKEGDTWIFFRDGQRCKLFAYKKGVKK